jgi:hypothetical protein
MTAIPVHYLDRLRVRGLLISEPFDSKADFFPDGVIVGKPASVIGHSLPEYKVVWDSGEVIDAPILWFHCDKEKWFVTILCDIGEPGPGDFISQWNTPEEAIADILDFYFGRPTRMDIQRKLKAERRTSGPS